MSVSFALARAIHELCGTQRIPSCVLQTWRAYGAATMLEPIASTSGRAAHCTAAAPQRGLMRSSATAGPALSSSSSSSSPLMTATPIGALQQHHAPYRQQFTQSAPVAASAAGCTQPGSAQRGLATESEAVPLTLGEFHAAADAALDHLQEHFEAFLDDYDVNGGDVEYSSGVLTVKLGSHGTYVINKQTPNHQIWLSSPVSGPFRYDYAGSGRWVYHRDGREMLEQLQSEIQDLLGSSPDLLSERPVATSSS